MVENKVSSAANNNSEGSGDFNDVDMKSPREREGFVNGVQVAKDKENGVMNDNELANGVVDIPSPTEQKSQVETLSKKTMVPGEKWFLVSCTWMRAFKKYCDADEYSSSHTPTSPGTASGILSYPSPYKKTHPGPINNHDIIYYDGRSVRSSLLENVDYELVPEVCWRQLVAWYGILPQSPKALNISTDTTPDEVETRVEKLNAEVEADPDSPHGEVRRFVIEEGCYIKFNKIEVYYLELSVYKYPDHRFSKKLKMSKSNTIEQLKAKLKHIYNIGEPKNVRLYGNFGSEMHEISKMSATLQDEGLFSNQQITIEVQNEDGSWPKKAIPVSNGIASTGSTAKLFSSSGSSHIAGPNSNVPGLCGLSNLGNTCFMNSALQCMSNVPPLTEYFKNNYHKAEINKENPLGMRGEIAMEYGDLVQTIWSGEASSTPPRQFKSKVGSFAPRFSGFQQHDSQELLSFLLDGLHEDLNRVKKKPYIEAKDDDNRNDDVVAKEAWENHLKRNDSIIVDMFHGQFKSTLVCPDCNKVSVTFDPYCFLSLPLPVKKLKSYDITFFRLNLEKPPTKLRVVVGDGCSVHEFQTAVSAVVDKSVRPDDMITTQVYNSRIHKTLSQEDTMGNMYGRDEYSVFEAPMEINKADCEFRFVPLLFREKNHPKSITNSYTCFGNPLFVKIPKSEITYDELYAIVLRRVKPFLEKEENIDPKELESLRIDDNAPTGDTTAAAKTQNGITSHSTSSSVAPTADEIDNFDEKGNVNSNTNNNNNECDSTSSMENGCSGGGVESEKGSIESTTGPGKCHYFKVSAVYSTGSTEIQKLPRTGSFKLNAQAYLACDWTYDARKVLFRPLDELVVPHDSLDLKVDLKRTIKLEDCIKQFLVAEKLGPMDSWYCPKCKDLKEATKKFDLWTLPHILVIHLKRFSYNRFFRDKLDNKIDFPTNQLALNEFVTNANVGHQVYDLIGVVNHYGGLGGGHYTAYCKHEPTENWYDYDDSRVSPLHGGEEAVKTSAAYVLFYRRRERTEIDIIPPSIKTQPNPDAVESSVDDEMDTV